MKDTNDCALWGKDDEGRPGEGWREGGRKEELVCLFLCLFVLHHCLQKLRLHISVVNMQPVLVFVSLGLLEQVDVHTHWLLIFVPLFTCFGEWIRKDEEKRGRKEVGGGCVFLLLCP